MFIKHFIPATLVTIYIVDANSFVNFYTFNNLFECHLPQINVRIKFGSSKYLNFSLPEERLHVEENDFL